MLNPIVPTPPAGDSSNRIADTAFVQSAIASAAPSIRTRLGTSTTIYVNAGTGSDSNNGSSPSSAFKTRQAAYNYIQSNFDFNGQVVTMLESSSTTITDTLFINSAWVGGGALAIDGGSRPWNVTSNSCVSVLDAALPGIFSVQNATFQTTTSGSCVSVEGSGVNLFIGTGITFGTCAGAHMVAQVFGHIEILNNYTISGGASQHFIAQINGNIDWAGPTVTVTGTPAFTTFGFTQINASVFFFGGANFTGAATGQRYQTISNSVLFTNGGGTTFLPGNSAGTTASGGQYL